MFFTFVYNNLDRKLRKLFSVIPFQLFASIGNYCTHVRTYLSTSSVKEKSFFNKCQGAFDVSRCSLKSLLTWFWSLTQEMIIRANVRTRFNSIIRLSDVNNFWDAYKNTGTNVTHCSVSVRASLWTNNFSFSFFSLSMQKYVYE